MNFPAFFSYVFLTTFTPGPNNIMAMASAGKNGFREALRFCLGVLFGMSAVLSCSAAFSSLLYRYIPSVQPVMYVIGAAYILFLAWGIWRDKPHEGRASSGRAAGVGTGMLLQLVNAKGILYSITIMSSYILPHYQSFPAVAGFVLFLALVCFSSTVCWALFGSAFDRFLKKYRKAVNAVMALLLVYCAVSMLSGLWN